MNHNQKKQKKNLKNKNLTVSIDLVMMLDV